MQPVRDPEGKEIEFLHRLGRLKGVRVIEIGCGTGRLTWRYASIAGSVMAIDSDSESVEDAREAAPPEILPRLSLAEAEAEALPFPRQRFDTAIFAWSL